MTRSTPLRLMILHLEHIFFTEGLTFMTVSSIFQLYCIGTNPLKSYAFYSSRRTPSGKSEGVFYSSFFETARISCPPSQSDRLKITGPSEVTAMVCSK